MRTTLTLDDENADRLREMATRTRRPFKQIVNDVIRRGLDSLMVEEVQAPYKVKASPMGLRRGIDPVKLSKLEAELDLETFEKANLQKGKGRR
ncbi:MAG: DUF2191 domain-containing protein [Puniceicoccaceae bacterium]